MCRARPSAIVKGMTDHPFRFGAVAGRAPDAAAWAGLARRAESLGYDTLLRRRDGLGVPYITVNAQFLETFAPVVERLAGT